MPLASTDIDAVYKLLSIAKELQGHPHLAALRAEVTKNLADYNHHLANPPEQAKPKAVPVYPADSGPIETGTEHETPESEKSEMRRL